MKFDRPLWKRRALLAGGGLAIVAWVNGAPYLASVGKPKLEFQALPGLEPFRRLSSTGAVTGSATGNIFVGLDKPETLTPEQLRLEQVVRSDPCKAIYGPAQKGPVPVAVFTDFACPNCRIMDARIAELEESDPDRFRIVHHQLPLLGPASATASRAALAADKQGAFREMHARLGRTPAVTNISFVTKIAANLGLDPDQFKADLQSEAVEQKLQLTKAIARVFAFYGTPAIAVGQTVFLGAVPTSTFETLVDYEAGNACQPA